MQNHRRPTVQPDLESAPVRAFLEAGNRPPSPPQPAPRAQPRPRPPGPPRVAQTVPASQRTDGTSEASYERLLSALPDLPPSRWGRAVYRLTRGRLRPGVRLPR
ncbi:hypothetical protein NORO109296_15195 [Nocardiopsis rhodophaea]